MEREDDGTTAGDAYAQAWESGDVPTVRRLLERTLEVSPDTEWAWFDLGLLHKAARSWAQCLDANRRALALAGPGEAENPAAWNLGIAATALGDGDTARQAWRDYGLSIRESYDGTPPPGSPVLGRFPATPVRINPPPRLIGQEVLLVDGQEGATEVVWCERRCPATAVVRNVPLPESRHRFGDVLLVDGVPVGSRWSQGEEVPVFEELEILRRSPLATFAVTLRADEDAVADLVEAVELAGGGAEDWSTVVPLCAECSEGRPQQSHAHAHPQRRVDERTMGLAGDRETLLGTLERWGRSGGGKRWSLRRGSRARFWRDFEQVW